MKVEYKIYQIVPSELKDSDNSQLKHITSHNSEPEAIEWVTYALSYADSKRELTIIKTYTKS